MSEEDKLDLLGIAGSNGVPVVELDNFQRYVCTFAFERDEKDLV
jgi:hypothetical protein